MAFLKTPSNIFLGHPELNVLKDTLDKEGFRRFVLENTATFGVVQNEFQDNQFLNCKVEEGTNAGTIKISFISAIDSNGNYITASELDNIAIPGGTSWVKISHTYSPIEKGTLSIATNGTITGVGTEFTKRLRGQPNYPSKVRFPNSASNTQDYEVLAVIDDNNAYLKGTFTAENDIEYAVAGTFTPGVPIPEASKLPFQYDACLIEFVAGGDEPPQKTDGLEFYIAKVTSGSPVLIEDKRNEIWQSTSTYELKSIDQTVNKFAGVEALKFGSDYSTRDTTIVEIAWGLRSTNWTASASLRQVTIANGQGGLFKKDSITTPFTDGDFNGWRLYFNSGKFGRIINSVIDAGAIKVTLDKLDPADFDQESEIFVCPDVEEVIIKVKGQVIEEVRDNYVQNEYAFPINTPLCRIPVLVPSEVEYLVNFQYRLRNNNSYSDFNSFESSTYFAEPTFDNKGNFLQNEGEWVVKSYTKPANLDDAYIEFIPNENSYRKVKDRLDRGDLFGVALKELSNSNPLTGLTVGESEVYQFLQNNSELTMTVSQIINLNTEGARAGNEFFVFLKGGFNSQNQHVIEVRQDYVNAGDQGTLIDEIGDPELKFGNIFLICVFDGTNWQVRRLSSAGDGADIGEIRMYSGSLTGRFNSSGLGISPRWQGWAICNGQNGTPDLRRRFIVGFDNASAEYQMGITGGEESVVLEASQMPEHNHQFTVPRSKRGTGNDPNQALGTPDSGAGFGPEVTITTTNTGGGQAHENRPPYYALAYVIKISEL